VELGTGSTLAAHNLFSKQETPVTFHMTLAPMPPTFLRMLVGHGLGVIRILFARYLISPSDLPCGNLTSVISLSAIGCGMIYPV
jgi:hypothetical protein